MMTFDAAVAEYLHRAGHPRPWTRRQEEDALDGLSGWLQAGRRNVPLRSVTPGMVARYAAERRLSPEEVDDLQGTLAGLRLWARTARTAWETAPRGAAEEPASAFPSSSAAPRGIKAGPGTRSRPRAGP